MAPPDDREAKMTDAQLVAAVIAGDTEAYALLVDRYQDRVVSAAYHIVGDRDAAEDLAQDTFVEGFKSIRRLRDPARAGAWFHGIAQRLCYKWLRRNTRISNVETEQFDLLAAPEVKPDEPGDLVHLLGELPAQYRQVLAARYLEDLEYEEIAEQLGTTVNNIRVRVHRAKSRLRELFEAVDAKRRVQEQSRLEQSRLRVVRGNGGAA